MIFNEDWMAAQRDFVDDRRPGESASDMLLRLIAAAWEMHDIETAYAAPPSGGERSDSQINLERKITDG